MRNWNKDRSGSRTGPVQVFTVPMRNWNVFELCHENPTHQSFYSTYEELKLCPFLICNSSLLKFLQYLWGIETCYVAGRSAWTSGFLQYLWGIETVLNNFFIFYYFKFLQYLWGIETGYLYSLAMSISKGFYSTYEELKLLDLFLYWTCFYSFYSTYEELKHHCICLWCNV